MPNSSKTHYVNCRFTPILQPSHEAMARHGGLTCRLCSGLLGLLWSCRPAGFGSIRSVILRCACRCGGIRLGSRRFTPGTSLLVRLRTSVRALALFQFSSSPVCYSALRL